MTLRQKQWMLLLFLLVGLLLLLLYPEMWGKVLGLCCFLGAPPPPPMWVRPPSLRLFLETPTRTLKFWSGGTLYQKEKKRIFIFLFFNLKK